MTMGNGKAAEDEIQGVIWGEFIALPFQDDEHQGNLISTMAMGVIDCSCAYKEEIMGRGHDSPLIILLVDLRLKDHTYYVWKVYSFSQEKPLQRQQIGPFTMVTKSGQWILPRLSEQEGTRSLEKEKRCSETYDTRSGCVDPARSLNEKLKGEFEDTLKAITLQRNQIKEAMNFSLDNVATSRFDETCALSCHIDSYEKMGNVPYSNNSSESDPNNKAKIVLMDYVRVMLLIIRRNLIFGMERFAVSMDSKQGYKELLLQAQSTHTFHSGMKPC